MPLERLDETCGSDNPFFVSPAYAMGDRKDEPALLAYRDRPERFVLATYDQIGATYGTAFDAEAVAAIARLFPGRRTVGRSARAILSGGGAFHCITQQQPEVL